MTVSIPITSIPSRPGERIRPIGIPAQSELDRFVLPRRGLQLPFRMPFERWVVIGRQLSTVDTSLAWCLGDWLIYGEAAYEGRYRDAIEQTSLEYQTLRNYAWVARRFSLSRRRDSLSFGHHAEVAGLPEAEQDYWLRTAENLGWSRNRLRREVRASLSERSSGAEASGQSADDQSTSEGDPRRGVHLNIQLTSEQSRLYEVAAARLGLPLEEWAIRTLEEAARDAEAESG
jgi:hypothetical protein